jgi:probable rRNA maturation factor
MRKSAQAILNALGYIEAELSVVIVDDAEIAHLNSEYRQVEGPTDVLAFAMRDGEFGDVCPEMLGDLVISAPTAQAMASAHSCSLQAVLDLLLIHGVLHLVGYDHEQPADARAMDRKSLNLLQELGYQEETFGWYKVCE